MSYKLGFALDYPGHIVKVLKSGIEGMSNLLDLQLTKVVEVDLALGFRHLEIPMDALLMLPGIAPEEAWQELNAMQEDGVSFSIHLPYIDVRLSSLNETLRRGSVATVKEAYSLCSSLEVEGYVLHLYSDLEREFRLYDAPPDLLQSAINVLLLAARRSLTEILEIIPAQQLFLENLEGLSPEITLQLAEEFDTRLCLDIGHAALQFRDPLPLIRKYAPRLGEIHLHDITRQTFNGRITYQEDHQALGVGWLDLPSIFRTLEEINFKGPVVLEVNTDQARASLDRLRELSLWPPKK